MRRLLTVHMPCIEGFFLSFFISRNEKCVRKLFALKERKAKGSARISKCQTEAKSSSERGTDAFTCSQFFSIFVSDAVSVTRLHEVFCNSKTYTK